MKFNFWTVGEISFKQEFSKFIQDIRTLKSFGKFILTGTTKVMATFLLQYNKTKVNLDKINFEEGNLTRDDYLQSIKEAVIVQSRAQKVLQEN